MEVYRALINVLAMILIFFVPLAIVAELILDHQRKRRR